MNRTRLVFFAVLAACLIILAVSAASNALSGAALLPVFVACTIFGAGVVAMDFMGLLGHHGGDLTGTAGHADGPVSDDGGGMGAHALGGQDTGAHVMGGGHDAFAQNGGHEAAGGDHVSHDSSGSREAAPAGHSQPVVRGEPNAAPMLSLLTYLRLLVYFCLGFGPAGWIVLAAGRGPLVSLGIAAPFGVASLFLARAFFRFQRSDTGAVPAGADIVREEAEVIVPLDNDHMGRVRVRAGMTVTDLYALAEDRDMTFKSGDVVRIVRATDDCVYVR